MKGLVYEAPRVMTLRELERPVPGPREVLVRVAYSGICGSELSGFLGQNSLRQPPLVFGHELSGHVDRVGSDVEGLQVGAPVTANPLVSCGRCAYCVIGRHQLCPSRLLLGASLPGSNADFVVVSASALEPVPDGLALRDAAMAEPAACGVHAVALSGAAPSDTALVVGAGPIGLFVIQALRAHGVHRVLAADSNAERGRLAAGLGAELVDADDLVAGVRETTRGTGVQVSFDAAGTETTRGACLAATAPGGSVMLIGLHTDQTTLSLNTAVRSEIAIRGVFAYSPAAFRTALAWLAEGRMGLREGVVEATLEEGPTWYQKLIDGDPAAKVLLRPGREQED